MNRPAIVWADEPTGDLDSETAAGIIDLMVQFNRDNGQTFVIVTHAREVGERAHRIVSMRDGQIVEHGLDEYFTVGQLVHFSGQWHLLVTSHDDQGERISDPLPVQADDTGVHARRTD